MRRVLLVLLILIGLLLQSGCVPALFLFNAVNPMQLTFITAFTVENRTDATVFVTPVGTAGPEGHRHPLPLTVWEAPWVPTEQRGRFPVRSGETITLHYDWDDINFSGLVVESEGGGLRQLVVNPDPTANQYAVRRQTRFVIDDWDRLGPVDPRVQGAYEVAQRPVRWWQLLAATTAPILTFALMWRWFRRSRPAPTPRPLTPAAPDRAGE